LSMITLMEPPMIAANEPLGSAKKGISETLSK
jgi:hypothetical protein